MKEKEGDHEINRIEPGDLPIIQRIGSIPRIRPRLLFRIRIFIYTLLPGPAAELVENKPRAGDAKARERRPLAIGLRAAAITGLALLFCFSIFAGLTLMARNSLPGDALYGVKRAREKMELAFTWGETDKARKNLDLAGRRIEELDKLIEADKVTPEKVESVARDFNENTQAVTRILHHDGGLQGAGTIANQLKVVKSEKENVVKRLSAEKPESVLASASGANIMISDGSTGACIDRGTANESGEFQFEYDPLSDGEPEELEASIELEGRSATLPLWPAEKNGVIQSGSITVRVEPVVSCLAVGEPELFTLYLSDANGRGSSGRQLRLRDSTSTSTINGKNSEVCITTDDRGRCQFTVDKTSASRVSRISLRVIDAADPDIGDIIVAGGIQKPVESNVDTVNVRSAGTSERLQSIEMSNGILTVSLNGGHPGRIISSVNHSTRSINAGPLDDPEMRNRAQAGLTVPTDGPSLLYADEEAAGYQIAFETDEIRKTYRVALQKGKSYAVVSCGVDHIDDDGTGEESPSLVGISNLQIPTGAMVVVGGNAVDASEFQQSAILGFSAGAPYATCETGSGVVSVTCPIDSDTYPDSWTVSENHVGLNLLESALKGTDRSVTTIIALADAGQTEQILSEALQGLGEVEPETDGESSDGFLLEVSPDPEALGNGNRQVVVTVYKKYQKVEGI